MTIRNEIFSKEFREQQTSWVAPMSKIQAKQEIREVKKSEDKEKIPLKLETEGPNCWDAKGPNC